MELENIIIKDNLHTFLVPFLESAIVYPLTMRHLSPKTRIGSSQESFPRGGHIFAPFRLFSLKFAQKGGHQLNSKLTQFSCYNTHSKE